MKRIRNVYYYVLLCEPAYRAPPLFEDKPPAAAASMTCVQRVQIGCPLRHFGFSVAAGVAAVARCLRSVFFRTGTFVAQLPPAVLFV